MNVHGHVQNMDVHGLVKEMDVHGLACTKNGCSWFTQFYTICIDTCAVNSL